MLAKDKYINSITVLVFTVFVGRLLRCLFTLPYNNSHVAMALLELIQNVIQWHTFLNPVIIVILEHKFIVTYQHFFSHEIYKTSTQYLGILRMVTLFTGASSSG